MSLPGFGRPLHGQPNTRPSDLFNLELRKENYFPLPAPQAEYPEVSQNG